MLNPVIKEMYSENVIDILERLRVEIEPLGIQCELCGVTEFEEYRKVPKAFYVDKYNSERASISRCWEELNNLMTPEETELNLVFMISDYKAWNKHLGGDAVPLWVK